MDCIRLRKNNLCRLDMKPCQEKCPLRKTKEEYELHDLDVKFNAYFLAIKQLEKCFINIKSDCLKAVMIDYYKIISRTLSGEG